MAEDKEDEEKESEKEILVVQQLPTQQVTTAKVGDKDYDLVTAEDALTEILKIVRELKKGLIS